METITWQKLKEAAEKKEAELKAFLKAEEDQKKMEAEVFHNWGWDSLHMN